MSNTAAASEATPSLAPKLPAKSPLDPTPPGERIAAYGLAAYLERMGVEVVFGLCGHTIIAMLDALRQSRIRYVSVRHEQVAAHAADGYARASGKPGVLLLHLGPGLTCAATGVANAALDSIPLVVIAGDVPSYYHGRHSHQEVNLHQDADQWQIYKPFCKRVYRVDRAADLPRVIERAFHLAQSGRPGPVLVDVPMDVFSADLPADAFAPSSAAIEPPTLAPATAERIARALAAAERPVIYVGGGVIASHAAPALRELAEALQVPVAHTLMGTGSLPTSHPLLLGMTGFWGTPIANEMCRTADLILAVGTRFGEANSSSWDPRYSFQIPPTRLMQLDIDAAEIGRNYPVELGAVADARLALEAIAAAAREQVRPARPHLVARIAAGRREFAAHWSDYWKSDEYPLRPERILSEVRQALPEDGFIVTDVGWNKNGVGQQFPITVPGTFITPSGLATMGFGAAAVLGVKYAQPGRAALCLIGDGGFGANPSVVATAMEAGLAVVWVIMDNAAFGTIAGLEQMHYGSEFGCVFENGGSCYRVDYAAMARACGARGVNITAAAELGPALREALASPLPTVVQVAMQNVPTPTPGYWNINDIYRPGR
ncbi:MAG TPA: thiamine pyrophosphate-binding protein [Terriglobales bacterium]|nr:thiamine pyrophosphate-binding protein [Terriglobales bacterium]